MHVDATSPGTTPPPPLFPGLGLGPAMEQHLRQSLTVLRDNASDAGVRERIDAVLAGGLSLRELAVDPDFGSMMNPLVDKGMRQLDEMSPEEDTQARAGAEAFERGQDPAAAMGLTPDELFAEDDPTEQQQPPASHGTW